MRAALMIPLVLACAAGCGGVDRGRPSADYQTGGGAPATGCEADDGLEFETIENFEDGRAQGWWISGDKTPDAVMDPPDGTQGFDASELDEPRCGESTSALHIRAEGLKIYGGAFGTSFLATDAYKLGRDASNWEGLSFWVKTSGEARGRSIFAAVNDRNTDASAQVSMAEAEGVPREDIVPNCDDDSLVESEKCDRFGAGVPLPEEWTFFAIPFEKMKQRGFGVFTPRLDVEALAGLNFSFEIGDLNLYIDDVAFYRAEESE